MEKSQLGDFSVNVRLKRLDLIKTDINLVYI